MIARAARLGALGLLGVVVLGFALLGFLSFFRDTPVIRVASITADGGPVAVAESTFTRAVALLTQTALHPGSQVEILNNGAQTFPRLWSDLRSARRSITIGMYYAQPGAVADTLLGILRERASAGVRVLFLYDSFGAQNLTETYLDSLDAGGVQVAAFRPMRWYTLDRAQHRFHVRAVVVDGSVGYTGGFGIDDKWLGSGRRPGEWREVNVRFTGPAVAQLQAGFAVGWAEATGTLLAGELFFPAWDAPPGTTTAGLLYTSPGIGSTPAERFLALSIAGAHRRLYITNSYFVPDPDLRRLLEDAARRDVDVRVLVPGEQTDVNTVRYAGRGSFDDLLRAGVRIYEYQPAMIHAKTFVADGIWSTIGGINFDNRSVALNHEATLMIHDPALGARLEAQFLQDLALSDEITAEEFADRPWWHRIVEWGAGLFSSLL